MLNYIYGAGGHGKVVLDAMQSAHIYCSGFVDDKQISNWMGIRVYDPSIINSSAEVYVHLAVGNCKVREFIAKRYTNASFFSVYHPSANVAKTSQISSGTFIAALSVVAPDAKIGCHCIINHSAVVDHDCIIGDFSHIAPSSSLGGGVKVGKGVLIGSGAIVLPGVKIADYVIVGAGAVVTKNITSGMTVTGNPAKPIKN